MTETTSASRQMVENFRFPAADALVEPYAAYHALQADSPVHKLPGLNAFVISRYEDIVAIAKQPEIFTQGGGELFATGELEIDGQRCPVGPAVSKTEPPLHTAYRSLTARPLSPGRLRERRHIIESIAGQVVDGFASLGQADLVSDFAERFSMTVVAALCGLPLDRVEQYSAWSDAKSELSSYRFKVQHGTPRDLQAKVNEMSAFLAAEVIRRQENPGGEDMFSEVIAAQVEHGLSLDLPDLVGICISLLVGGSETSSHLIPNTILHLLRHPDQLELVRRDRKALRNAIEESLRVDAPSQVSPRKCVRDAEIGGVKIPAGSHIFLMWGAGNRETSVFDDPDRFDVTRPNAKTHLAFGRGIHTCIGAPLARLQAEVAVGTVLERLPGLALARGFTPERLPLRTLRPLASLPVVWDID